MTGKRISVVAAVAVVCASQGQGAKGMRMNSVAARRGAMRGAGAFTRNALAQHAKPAAIVATRGGARDFSSLWSAPVQANETAEKPKPS